jgi:hypothetical protein
MEFSTGVFHKYRATKSIRLGSVDNFVFTADDVFEFDGNTVKLPDGRSFEVPQIRAAIKSQWFVPDSQVASTQVQDTKVGRKKDYSVTETDEVEVSLVRKGTNPMLSQADPLVDDVIRMMSSSKSDWETKHHVAIAATPSQTLFPVTREDESELGGTFISRVERTPEIQREFTGTKPQPANLSTSTFESGVQVHNELGEVRAINTSQQSPISVEETARARAISNSIQIADKAEASSGGRPKKANASEEVVFTRTFNSTLTNFVADDATVSSTAIDRIQENGNPGTAPKATSKKASQPTDAGVEDGVVVSRVLSPAKRDFLADDRTVNSTAIDRVEKGSDGLNIERYVGKEGDSVEDLIPEAARPHPPIESDSEKLQRIRQSLPDFNWNKDRLQKERVQEALTHYKNPELMKAIIEYENPLCAEEIKKGLAKLLAKSKKKSDQD